jgi:hypothetical protein
MLGVTAIPARPRSYVHYIVSPCCMSPSRCLLHLPHAQSLFNEVIPPGTGPLSRIRAKGTALGARNGLQAVAFWVGLGFTEPHSGA